MPRCFRSGLQPAFPPHPSPVEQAKTQLLIDTFQLQLRGGAKKQQAHNSATKNTKKRQTPIDLRRKKPPPGPEHRREYERARSTTPERKEYQRQSRQRRIQIAKEAGKCRDCSNLAIPSQTMCETCAEKHRISRRKNDARRRAEAKKAITIADEFIEVQPKTCRDCKGLARPGRTRCEQCANRENARGRQRRSEKKGISKITTRTISADGSVF